MLATMPRKKKNAGQEPVAVPLSFRAEESMAKIIDDLAKKNRHTRSITIVILLEKALSQLGLWPPK